MYRKAILWLVLLLGGWPLLADSAVTTWPDTDKRFYFTADRGTVTAYFADTAGTVYANTVRRKWITSSNGRIRAFPAQYSGSDTTGNGVDASYYGGSRYLWYLANATYSSYNFYEIGGAGTDSLIADIAYSVVPGTILPDSSVATASIRNEAITIAKMTTPFMRNVSGDSAYTTVIDSLLVTGDAQIGDALGDTLRVYGQLKAIGMTNDFAGSLTDVYRRVTIGPNFGVLGDSIFFGSSGDLILRHGAMDSTSVFQFPANEGTAGQYLKVDGAGNTSWDAPAGSGDITSVGTLHSYLEVSADSASGDPKLGLNLTDAAAGADTFLVSDGAGGLRFSAGDGSGGGAGDVTGVGTANSYLAIADSAGPVPTLKLNVADAAADADTFLVYTDGSLRFSKGDGAGGGAGDITSVGTLHSYLEVNADSASGDPKLGLNLSDASSGADTFLVADGAGGLRFSAGDGTGSGDVTGAGTVHSFLSVADSAGPVPLFGANLTAFDARYINEGAAGDLTGAGTIHGFLTVADSTGPVPLFGLNLTATDARYVNEGAAGDLTAIGVLGGLTVADSTGPVPKLKVKSGGITGSHISTSSTVTVSTISQTGGATFGSLTSGDTDSTKVGDLMRVKQKLALGGNGTKGELGFKRHGYLWTLRPGEIEDGDGDIVFVMPYTEGTAGNVLSVGSVSGDTTVTNWVAPATGDVTGVGTANSYLAVADSAGPVPKLKLDVADAASGADSFLVYTDGSLRFSKGDGAGGGSGDVTSVGTIHSYLSVADSAGPDPKLGLNLSDSASGADSFLVADGAGGLRFSAGDGAGGGSGDNVSVNGSAATDADLDNATPAAPAGGVNILWQKDAGTPNNVSGYLDVGSLPRAMATMPFMQAEFLNGFAGVDEFLSSYGAITSGAGVIGTGVASHPGIVSLRAGTAQYSGYYVASAQLDNSVLICGGERFDIIFNPTTLADLRAFMGLDDFVNTTGDGADCLFFTIVGDSLSGECQDDNATTTARPKYKLTADTWYRGTFIVNSDATSVVFYLYNMAGTELWSKTITTNIPKATGDEMAHTVRATSTNAAPNYATLIAIDYVSFAWTKALTR